MAEKGGCVVTDFGIGCVCLLIGYIVRTISANRSATVLARIEAHEERIGAIECAVFEYEGDGDDGPDGGDELPADGPSLRLVGGAK